MGKTEFQQDCCCSG
uniref:Uncharacterized protein n=1 Tax=Arundo donax TaxID=35708 RepID=A0A0A8YHF5_ARUDO